MGLMGMMLGKKSDRNQDSSEDLASHPLSLFEIQEMYKESANPSPEFKARQKEKFRSLYGRDPVPGKDPLFFDPAEREPSRMTADKMKAIIIAKMNAMKEQQGGIPGITEEEKELLSKNSNDTVS